MQVQKLIYQVWTGNNPLTFNRVRGLMLSRANLKPRIKLVCPSDLARLSTVSPIHPAYKYLSCVHKSDYLRSYLMNFYGGGYADIKPFSPDNNFEECFNLMDSEKTVEIIGAPELRLWGTVRDSAKDPELVSKLLSCGWFIARPHTRFTETWYSRVCKLLDEALPLLVKHPATEPFGGPGYPLRWFEVLGEIFHPLCKETFDDNPDRILYKLKPGVIQGAYR